MIAASAQPPAPATRRRAIIPAILREHAEEAEGLYAVRAALVHASTSGWRQLDDCDQRLAAQLDGLVAGNEPAWPIAEGVADMTSAGSYFVATVRAIDRTSYPRLNTLIAQAQEAEGSRAAVVAGFGWVEPDPLQGIVASLLDDPDPRQRLVGVAACALHRVDPGFSSRRQLEDADATVRARALRTAGELGRHDLIPFCARAVADDDAACRAWGAWAAVLLGDRDRALQSLREVALVPGPARARAFRLAMQTLSPGAAHAELKGLARHADQLRWVIEGSGIVGDPIYVPWLINQLTDTDSTRLAGEAFALITGADPSLLDPERTPPGNPCPDADRIRAWWAANSSRFQAGARYFMGSPVTREHCIEVLKTGSQLQRILAAHYLSLLNPGTPLFNTSAPAWRQQRLLAEMT